MKIIKIVDTATGAELEREMTVEELAAFDAAVESLPINGEQTAAAAAKAELLERLGITADEAKLLLS